jgi:hypothetical protein
MIEKMKLVSRDWAIWAVDGVHGYTCEHSPNPQEHADEYDQHEADFKALCDLALQALSMAPRPLSEIEGTALIFRQNHVGEEQTVVIYKYPNGEWKSHVLAVPYPASTLAIPRASLTSLPTPGET